MKRWYVIRSKYRHESLLWQQLCSRLIEVYYPRVFARTTRLSAQKGKPYFPGYMFARVDLDVTGWSELEWMAGAVGLVFVGGEPAFVSDTILRGIRERVDWINVHGADRSLNMRAGDEIEVHDGPFAGYRGIFGAHLSDRERAIVFLRFIRDQQVRVELPLDQIESTKQRCAQL